MYAPGFGADSLASLRWVQLTGCSHSSGSHVTRGDVRGWGLYLMAVGSVLNKLGWRTGLGLTVCEIGMRGQNSAPDTEASAE